MTASIEIPPHLAAICGKLGGLSIQHCLMHLNAWRAAHGESPLSQWPGAETDGTANRFSPFRQVVNYGIAQIRHTLDGRRKVPDDIYKSRIAQCVECSSKHPDRLQCLEKNCGCDLTLKAEWASESCPLEKWGRFTPPK